jgi:NADPH-dependent 2,4-dienoyl-CoA reductase/sulfur reductase-like enzyme/rhodanese-related sulfurtransferase
MSRRVLIIGGVATGPKTAARLRRLDEDAEITIVERGDLLSYAGCGMPFYIEDTVKEYNKLLGGNTIRDSVWFKASKNVTVLDRTEALKINRSEKTVTVKSLRTGEQKDLTYDKLVLATGASPIVPRMDGTELNGVHRLYTPHDARTIKEAVNSWVRNVAIVGGGLIGLETCGAFVTRGCRVTILEMMPYLVPNLLDEEMALRLEKYLKEKGVEIVKGSPVSRIIGDSDGKVTGVETANGNKIDADLVIMAIGVRPNTQLASEAGLKIGPTRAIAVNDMLQTSDPDIYAGGDCVESTHLVTDTKIYAPMGSTANKHGRIIADNIAEMKTSFPGITGTSVFKVLDYNCGSTGLTEAKSRDLGYNVVTCMCPRSDYSSYIPGAQFTLVKLVGDLDTGKLLGCQVLGKGDGIKRIDVAATVLKYGGTVKDLADLDLGYAPAYSTAIDAIAHAANVFRNKAEGLLETVTPQELKTLLESDSDDFVLVDCRGKNSFESGWVGGNRTVNVPIGKLRSGEHNLPQDKEIIFTCLTSVTAWNAVRILKAKGYEKVKLLEGSLMGWPYD